MVYYMFEKSKISHQYTVTCKNGDKTGTYTFIASPDDEYGQIAERMFFDEFGIYPNEIRRDSMVAV